MKLLKIHFIPCGTVGASSLLSSDDIKHTILVIPSGSGYHAVNGITNLSGWCVLW
jgi:hypothetical protein